MTAKELDIFVNTLREHGLEIHSRYKVGQLLEQLAYATEAIGMQELTRSIYELQWAINDVNTLDVVEMGTFK